MRRAVYICVLNGMKKAFITYCTYRTQTIYGGARFEVRTLVFRQLMMLFCSKTRFKEG